MMEGMRRFRTVLSVAVALAAAVGAAGCGKDAATQAAPAPTTAAVPTTVAPEPQDPGSLVAILKGPATLYAERNGAVLSEMEPTTQFGTFRALLVRKEKGDWLQVQLPTRPNGSRAWIERDAAVLQRVHTAIDVNLTTRTLTLTERGDEVLTTPVVIGTSVNPTPQGLAYITDVIPTNNDRGAYGPFAMALSTHSETLTEFAGGDGQVAIHGTNRPDLMGQAASHGCIRVPNLVAIAIAKTVSLGTPVDIHV
jgi:lipoprotein-anchoring transpeptidase ErfK/SrfK